MVATIADQVGTITSLTSYPVRDEVKLKPATAFTFKGAQSEATSLGCRSLSNDQPHGKGEAKRSTQQPIEPRDEPIQIMR